MRDSIEAISRDTDVPVDWVRWWVEDVRRRERRTPEQARAQVRAALEGSFHGAVQRWLATTGAQVRKAFQRVARARS